jgi:hypothetical protein
MNEMIMISLPWQLQSSLIVAAGGSGIPWKNGPDLCVKWPLFLFDFNWNWISFIHFRKRSSMNSHENLISGSRDVSLSLSLSLSLSHREMKGWTNRRHD